MIKASMSIISSRDNNTFVEFSDDDIMTPFDGRHFLDGTERFWVVPTLSGWRHFSDVTLLRTRHIVLSCNG